MIILLAVTGVQTGFAPKVCAFAYPDNLINGITTYGGSAIAIIYTECHSTSSTNSSTSDSPAFKQLLQTLGNT